MGSVIADRPFSERVLERLRVAEQSRQKREGLKFLAPIGLIVVIGGTWAVALFDGVIALRMVIEIVAIVVTVGNLEQHLGLALLGPFAPVPLIVSLLLFVSAIGWVRVHQPEPPGITR